MLSIPSQHSLSVCDSSTGYNLFCKEQVKDMKGVDKNSYCYVLAKCWKELTEKKRKEYSERCSQVPTWKALG